MKDILRDLLGLYTVVVPGSDDGIDGVLDDSLSDLSCRLVQNKSEVVFRKERVGRIRGVRVVPNLFLVMGVDHRLRRRSKCFRCRPDERLDKGFKGGDDED